MIPPEKPANEAERLSSVHSYSILDTLPEEDYDNLTAIAAQLCETNMSLVTLIDENRQWFKSHQGMDITETPREYSFCAHAIQDPDNIFIIPDTRKDERFHDNPLVLYNPHITFYAGVPLKNDEGMALGTICVLDEKPKQLSDYQKKALECLSKQVVNLLELRKKTNELERALQDKEKKNQELEEFASRAAHDIRSPLGFMISMIEYTGTYHGKDLNEEVRENIESIKEASYNLKDLVEALLTHSRSDKLLQEKPSTVLLKDLRHDIEKTLLIGKDSTLHLNTDLKEISINKTAVEQILLNLVTNAIKYNDKEKAEIEIGVSDKQSGFEFYVQDNGPGIPPENQEAVFQPFNNMNKEDRYGQPGSGLGLTTVKKLAEGLGGNVRLDSQPNEGTKVTFTIPKM